MYCRLALLVAVGAAWWSAPANADTPGAVPGPEVSFRASVYAYTAYGSHYAPVVSETVTQRYTFTGREAAGPAAAPMYYRNRMYSPGLGRFGRRDPVLDAGNGFAPYGGFRDDPVNWTDHAGTYTEAEYEEEKLGFGGRLRKTGKMLKRTHRWVAEEGDEGDTLPALARKVGGDSEDWVCISPVRPMKSRDLSKVSCGDEFDTSSITARAWGPVGGPFQGRKLLITFLETGHGQDFEAAKGDIPITAAVARKFTGSEWHFWTGTGQQVPEGKGLDWHGVYSWMPVRPASLAIYTIQKFTDEGNRPLTHLILSGHGGTSGEGGGLENIMSLMPPADYSAPVRDEDKSLAHLSQPPTHERALQRHFPIRCWFARDAKAWVVGCSAERAGRDLGKYFRPTAAVRALSGSPQFQGGVGVFGSWVNVVQKTPVRDPNTGTVTTNEKSFNFYFAGSFLRDERVWTTIPGSLAGDKPAPTPGATRAAVGREDRP